MNVLEFGRLYNTLHERNLHNRALPVTGMSPSAAALERSFGCDPVSYCCCCRVTSWSTGYRGTTELVSEAQHENLRGIFFRAIEEKEKREKSESPTKERPHSLLLGCYNLGRSLSVYFLQRRERTAYCCRPALYPQRGRPLAYNMRCAIYSAQCHPHRGVSDHTRCREIATRSSVFHS